MRILYFLSLLIIVLSAVQKGEAWKRSTLYIGADDVLTNLYVNDNEIDLSDVDDLSTYSIVKKVDLALFPNDEIKIKVINKNPVSIIDNAGLAVKMNYVDQNGNEKTFYTNLDDWECNGDKPMNKNIVMGLHYPTWATQELRNVNVIWAEGNPKEATCTFVIPKR